MANLQKGQATVKTISQASKIAREDIYRTLPSLQALGLITKHLSSPARYEATKPKDAIDMLLRLKEKEHSALKEKACVALENLTKQDFGSDELTDDDMIVVSKDENVHTVTNATKNAKHSIYFTTRYNLFIHTMNDLQLTAYIKEMNKAAQRGIQFRMITDKPAKARPVSELNFQVPYSKALVENPNFEYRHAKTPPKCIMIIYDNEKCLIETCPKPDVEVSPFIWTNNNVLLELSKVYFEKTWKNAVKPSSFYKTASLTANA